MAETPAGILNVLYQFPELKGKCKHSIKGCHKVVTTLLHGKVATLEND